jgi:hypothetical protein
MRDVCWLRAPTHQMTSARLRRRRPCGAPVPRLPTTGLIQSAASGRLGQDEAPEEEENNGIGVWREDCRCPQPE